MQLTSAENANPSTAATFDPRYETIVVIVNCSPTVQTFPFPAGVRTLQLHPAMAGCADSRLMQCKVAPAGSGTAGGNVTVAPRCAAVFVQPRV